MKKLLLLSLLLSLLSLVVTPGLKAEGTGSILKGYYVSIGGGAGSRVQADDELAMALFNDGYLVKVAAGYKFDTFASPYVKNLRAELEYSRQSHKINKLWLHPLPAINRVEKASGYIDIEAVQAVLYYDFKSDSRATPFVGFGIGVGRSVLNELACPTLLAVGGPAYPLSTITDYALAVSPRLGFNYKITDTIEVGLAARYYFAPNGVVVNAGGDNTHPGVAAWDGELSVAYNF